MFDGFFIPSTETFEERDLFAWLRQREETGWLDGLFKADAGTTGKGAPAAPTVKQPGAGTGAGGGAGAPSVHAPSVSTGGGGGSSAKLGSEAPAHRWLRRELKGAKASGGNEYRYFYTEGQGLGRVAKEGAEVNLGHKKGTDDHIRVTKVDRENNKITYKKLKANKDDAGNLTHFDEHEGEHTTDSKGWNSMMEQHFGDSHHTATDARVRRWANAVYTKVPHEVFKQTWDDATGSKMTGDQIVAHLKASSDKVHQKMGKSLERTFRDNGIGDEHDAREAIGFLLSRRGWHPSARAAMLGMMEHGGYEAARVAKNYRTIARSAEKSAKNGMVTGAHLHAALRGTKTVGQYHEAKSSRMATLLHEHNEDLHKRGEKPVSMDDFQMFRKAHAGKRAWETRQKNKENTPTQKRMFGKVEDMSADEFAAWHKTTKEKEDKREKKFTEEFLDSPLPAAAASEEEKAAPHAEGKLVEQLQSAKGGKAGARENKELDAYVKGLSPEQKEAWDRNHEYYLQKWRDARAAREAGKKTAKTAPGVSAAPAGIDYAKDTPQAREERLRNPARRRETGTISPDLQRDFVDRMRRDLEKQGHGELDYPTIANYAREASKAYEKNFGDKVPAGHFAEAGVQYLNGGFPELPRYRPGQSPPPPSTTKQSAEGGHVPETRGPVGAAPKQSMAEAAAEMYGSAAPARPAVYTPEGLTPEQHRENVAAMKAGSPLPHKVGPDRKKPPGTTSGATMPDVAAEAGAGVGVSSGTAAANQDDDWAALRARHGEGLADVVGEGPEEESLHDQLHGDAKLAYQGADDAALADVRRRFEAARGQLTSEEGEALHQHISDIEQQRARDKDAEGLPEIDAGAGTKQYHTARGVAATSAPGTTQPSAKTIKERAPTVHDDALELVQQGLDQYGSPLEGRWPKEHVDQAHAAVTQALAASLPDIAAQDPSVRQTPSLLERMHADLTRAKQGERKDTDLSGVFAPVGSSSVTPRSTPQQRAAEVLSNSLWDVNNREQHERPGHLAAVEQLVDEQHRKGLIGATEHRNLHVQLQNAKQRHGIEPHPVDQDVELAGQAATHAPDDVAEHLQDAVDAVHQAAAQGDADAGEHAEKVLAAAEELAEQGAIDEETVDDLHDELGDVVATHPVPEQEVRPVPAPPAEQPADSSAASEPAIAEVAGESAPVDAEKPRGAEPFERPPGSAGKSTGTLQVEQLLSDPAFMAASPEGGAAKVAPPTAPTVDAAVQDESVEESEAPSDGGWEPLDEDAVARLDERDAAVRRARKALKNKQITQEEADEQIRGARKRYDLAEQAAKKQGEEDEYPEEEAPSMPPWDAEVQPPSANHEHLTPDELEDAASNAHEEGSATDEDHEIIQALPKTDKKGKPSEKGYSQAERNGVSLVVGKALQQLADHYNDHNGEHMSSDMALSNAYEDFEPEEFDYTDDKGNDKTGKAKMPSSKTFHEQAVRYLDSVRWREKEGVPPQTGPSETPTVDAAVEQDSPAPAVEDAREPDVLPPSDVAALGGAARTSSDMVLDTTPSVDVERKYTLPRKDFPAHIKQALKEQKHNRKDYEVRVGNTFSPWGSATDGTRPHTSLVDLNTGKVRHSEGAWGGDDLLAQVSSLHDPNQDYKAKHEIPKGHAVVVGQTGYEPATTAHIHMRPEDYDAHFGANATGNQVPTAAQKKVLDALSMMSHARERHFQENKLGAYSPNNSRVKELIELGWVQPTPKGGLQLTTKGKNAQRLLGIAGVPYKKEDAAPPPARTVVHDVEVEGAPSTAPALEALSGAAQSTPPLAAPEKKEASQAPSPPVAVVSGGRPSFVRNAPRRRGAGLMPSDDELAQMGQAAESAPSAPPEAKPPESPLSSAAGAEGGQDKQDFAGIGAAHGVTSERAQYLQQHFGAPSSLEEGRARLSSRSTVLQQAGFGVPQEHAAGWKSEHSSKLHEMLSAHALMPSKVLRSRYANSGDRGKEKDAERLQRYMGDGHSPLNHAQQPLTDSDMHYMRAVRNAVKDHVAQVGTQTTAHYAGEKSVGGPSTKGRDLSSATPEAVDEQRQLADHRGALDVVWSKDDHPAKVAAHGALNAAAGGNHKAAIAGMADVVKHEFFGKNASHTDEAARHHALTQLAAVNAAAALAEAKEKNEAVDKGIVVQDAVKAVANDFGPLASPGPARKDGKAGPNVVDRWVDSALDNKSGASVQEALKKTGDKDHGALFDKTAKGSSRSASMLRWLSRLGKGFGKLASILAVAAAMAVGSAGVLPESSFSEAAGSVHREAFGGDEALPSGVPSLSDKKEDEVGQEVGKKHGETKPIYAADSADYLKQAFDKGSAVSLGEASKDIEESFKKKEPTRLRLNPEDAPTTGNAVADKATALAREYAGGVGYKLGAGGKEGKSFDCSSFVAHVLGKPWMDTDSIWRDAKGKQKHYEQVHHGEQQAGDVVVYPDYREGGKAHQGHVAILVDPRPENMTMVDASESDRGVHYRKMSPAFAQRDKVIFARPVMRKALDAYDLLEDEIWREAA